MQTFGNGRAARGQAFAFALTLASAAGLEARGGDELKGAGFWMAEAARDQVATAAEPGRPLKFHKEPALRWTNPVYGTQGALFLWTDRGRPEVAANLWQATARGGGSQVNHEFQSLALAPLIGRHDGRVAWSPTAGVAPLPVPDAPPVAGDAAERLRQMRALAREFKATVGDPPHRSELRTLAQPLYRYEPDGARADVVDGALFGFVLATDPEALLLIEARAVGGGPAAWHYAVARHSAYPLRAEHKGREVWHAEWVADFADPTRPFWALADVPAGP